MCFLPEWSLPTGSTCGILFPLLAASAEGRGLPSPPAIQVDPKYFFAREKAYDLLGFDEVRWLNEAPGIQRAAAWVIAV